MKIFTVRQSINLAKTLVMDWDKEQVIGIYLNSDNSVVHSQLISLGTADSSLIHPREVFRPAIQHSCVGVVVLHNDPSGSTVPSQSDEKFTKNLMMAGGFVQIQLIDSIIFTRGSRFYSFMDKTDKSEVVV